MRKNFKARMTAKNMNITEYNKETLIRLMIFASQIGELNSNEAKRTIDLSRKWEITNLSEINSVRSLKRLKETGWLEQQDISDYIAILVDILSQSDFFDIQQTLISTLNQYALDYKNLEPEVLPDVLKEIRFSNVDFSNQFYGNNGKREVSQSEKYANFMYLSNQLAHAFCANVEGMQNWQTNHLVQELFKIKYPKEEKWRDAIFNIKLDIKNCKLNPVKLSITKEGEILDKDNKKYNGLKCMVLGIKSYPSVYNGNEYTKNDVLMLINYDNKFITTIMHIPSSILHDYSIGFDLLYCPYNYFIRTISVIPYYKLKKDLEFISNKYK